MHHYCVAWKSVVNWHLRVRKVHRQCCCRCNELWPIEENAQFSCCAQRTLNLQHALCLLTNGKVFPVLWSWASWGGAAIWITVYMMLWSGCRVSVLPAQQKKCTVASAHDPDFTCTEYSKAQTKACLSWSHIVALVETQATMLLQLLALTSSRTWLWLECSSCVGHGKLPCLINDTTNVWRHVTIYYPLLSILWCDKLLVPAFLSDLQQQSQWSFCITTTLDIETGHSKV